MATVNSTWQKQEAQIEKTRLNTLPTNLRKLVTDNFKILSWSPDETKILYKADDSVTLATITNPRLIGTDSTPEQRTIKKDSVYVYDVKEDRNYNILDSLTSTELPLTWLPDSKHLIFVHNQRVDIMEYDGVNQTTVFAGPFVNNYVFPWPDGSKIVILTNLGNQSIAPNLYTIELQ